MTGFILSEIDKIKTVRMMNINKLSFTYQLENR